METNYKDLSDIVVDRENPKEGIYKIITQLRPHWTENETTFEVVSGGFVNKTIKVVNNNNVDDGLVIRVDGPIARKVGLYTCKEVSLLRHLNAHGTGLPLFASFANGLVSKLLRGGTPSREDMSDKTFAREVARTIADMHFATQTNENNNETQKPCSLIRLIKNCLADLRGELLNTELVKKFIEAGADFDDIEREADYLYEELLLLGIPTGLAHNDVWYGNMIYDRKNGNVTLLDYEMSDIGFLPYDLASYLLVMQDNYSLSCGSGGKFVCAPKEKSGKPSEEFCKFLIRKYLERLAELDGKLQSSVTEQDVNKYYYWTFKCSLLYRLMLSVYDFYVGHKMVEEGANYDVVGFCMFLYNDFKSESSRLKHLKPPGTKLD